MDFAFKHFLTFYLEVNLASPKNTVHKKLVHKTRDLSTQNKQENNLNCLNNLKLSTVDLIVIL